MRKLKRPKKKSNLRVILVCGGRTFAKMPSFYEPEDYDRLMARVVGERSFLFTEMDKVVNMSPDNMLGDPCVIVHGKADGADTCADDWAITNWKEVRGYPADWITHKKAAGYIRNAEMLAKEDPDLIVSFPGSKGTAMMVELARNQGYPIIKFTVADVDRYIASLPA